MQVVRTQGSGVSEGGPGWPGIHTAGEDSDEPARWGQEREKGTQAPPPAPGAPPQGVIGGPWEERPRPGGL